MNRMKYLVELLSKACYEYYMHDKQIMTDSKYDQLYDELADLEKSTGIVLGGSPTQKVQGGTLEYLPKVTHTKPMLSAAKTKSVDVIKDFVGTYEFYGSYKLDGLTLVVRYQKGQFVQAITRGNGTVGEDVTGHAKFIQNLPMHLNTDIDLELRGECVISWEWFNKINDELENPYSHPRNLAAGTLRNLDTNITKRNNLSFVVFEIVSGIPGDSKLSQLNELDQLGFETVGRVVGSVENIIECLSPEHYPYPTDGIVFELTSHEVSHDLGATAHHENCRMAFKWQDTLYETILRNVEWNTSKNGVVCPVAVFDPVDLDGAITTRATLHNLSIFESLELGIGDTIQVYRSNMVIPAIHDNLTRSNTLIPPKFCPSCYQPLKVEQNDKSKVLVCTNEDCDSRFIKKLVHFCSKDCMNVENISEKILEKFILLMSDKKFHCIYEVLDKSDELQKMDGFGGISIEKYLNNLNRSRKVQLQNFINALSIPGVGKTTSDVIAEYFDHDWKKLEYAFTHDFDFSIINTIGPKTNKEIHEWLSKNLTDVLMLADQLEFQHIDQESNKLRHLDFAITGTLNKYKNRKELEDHIKKLGGRVNKTVTKETNYLINNDKHSNSSKNKRALSYGIDIITEDEFINLITQL